MATEHTPKPFGAGECLPTCGHPAHRGPGQVEPFAAVHPSSRPMSSLAPEDRPTPLDEDQAEYAAAYDDGTGYPPTVPLFDVQRCRVCGCTDDDACQPPCWWVEPDLCSDPLCIRTAAREPTAEDRLMLAIVLVAMVGLVALALVGMLVP
jgi:hypothetical protein